MDDYPCRSLALSLAISKKIHKNIAVHPSSFFASKKLGGGNSNIFGIFTPIPGEDFQFDDHIFQMGAEKTPYLPTFTIFYH